MTASVDVVVGVLAARDRDRHSVAATSEEGAATYDELASQAAGIAAALRERGVGQGARVAVALDRSPSLLAAFLGVLGAGAAYVPLDPANPTSRLEHVLADAAPALVIADGPGAALAQVAGLPLLDPRGVAHDEPGSLRPGDPADPAYVIYTSGSTGRPKGVVVSRAALNGYLRWCVTSLPFTGGGVPMFASASFDHAITCYWPPLMMGEAVHLLPPIHGGRSLAEGLLRGDGYSFVKITPSHARMLSMTQRAELGRLAGLVMFGGEELSAALVDDVRRDAPDLVVLNHYGPTEATVGCSVHVVPPGPAVDPVPIGVPIAEALFLVCDPTGKAVAARETGELLVGGPVLADGYLGLPEETHQRFVVRQDRPGRWYRTGDLVTLGHAGAFIYSGRADDQVKVLGHRIEPAEIERALLAHPGVGAAAVVVIGADGDRELLAAVTARPGTDRAALVRELPSHLRERLPGPMVPRRLGVLDELPVAAGGKLDRAELARLIPRPGAESGDVLSRVCARFAMVLGVDTMSPDADFFELGGDSLSAVELVTWAEEDTDSELGVASLFEHPTPREFASLLG